MKVPVTVATPKRRSKMVEAGDMARAVVRPPTDREAPSVIQTSALGHDFSRVQAKLAIGEADRVAPEVMGPLATKLQRNAFGAATPTTAPPIVHEVLRSPGQPLDGTTRRAMAFHLHNSIRRKTIVPTAASYDSEGLEIGPADDRFEQEANRIATTIPTTPVRQPPKDVPVLSGLDLRAVRIHTGDRAAKSVRVVNARAYTVGHHIVFGTGYFAPRSRLGQRLLAHELTHVAQQTDDHKPRLQRTMTECRALMTPVTAPTTLISGTAVHRLIQADFARTPGAISIMIPGASAAPQRTQGLCGEDTTVIKPQILGGRAGGGFPDLALRTPGGDLQVAEIKPATLLCLVDGEKQLLRYVEQGNAPDPQQAAWRSAQGVKQVMPMPESAYAPPNLTTGGLSIQTAWCTPGLLVYKVTRGKPIPIPVPVPDPKGVKEKEDWKMPIPVLVPARELTPLLIVLTAGAMLIKFAGKRLTAPLTAIAAIILLANGAEASIGLEGEDPLEALFKLSASKGQPIPDDIKDALRKDHEMRRLLTDAVRSGNYTEAQRKAGESFTRTILANRDQFTQQELEILLEATDGAKGSVPQGDLTVEEIKRAIEAKKKGTAGGEAPGGAEAAGSSGEGGKAREGGTKKMEQPGESRTPPLSPTKSPEERLVEGMASKEVEGPKLTATLKEKLLATARSVIPRLTDQEVTELLKRLKSAAGKTEEEVVESVRKGISALRAGKHGGAGLTSTEPTAPSKEPPKSSGVKADDKVSKVKQGKKDPKLKALLEKHLGWIKRGSSFVLGHKDIAFKSGKPFTGTIVGRDSAGDLFYGEGLVTPRLVNGDWQFEVPAGIRLQGAAGYYGTTKKTVYPALPGVAPAESK